MYYFPNTPIKWALELGWPSLSTLKDTFTQQLSLDSSLLHHQHSHSLTPIILLYLLQWQTLFRLWSKMEKKLVGPTKRKITGMMVTWWFKHFELFYKLHRYILRQNLNTMPDTLWQINVVPFTRDYYTHVAHLFHRFFGWGPWFKSEYISSAGC